MRRNLRKVDNFFTPVVLVGANDKGLWQIVGHGDYPTVFLRHVEIFSRMLRNGGGVEVKNADNILGLYHRIHADM